jgi:competence protein ComEC
MPWLPVAFGAGVIIYFTAEREPVWRVASLLAAAAMAVAYGLRARPVAFPVALGCAAIATGLATGAIKAHLYDHAVLQRSAYGVSVTGFVETHEEREKSERMVLRVTSIDGPRLTEHPERIRLTLRKGTAPPVGAHVAFKARLNPPASPFRPGGYDLARDLYFRGIAATGLALGAIRIEAPPIEPDWRLQFAIGIESIRDAIDARIRAAVKDDSGSIASALITGKEDAISGEVFDSMFISGVGHVLSISGYHMALVAGVVIFFVRAGLALVPGLALRYPIKKWAAAVALLAATFYLALSGAEVATQRSFVMIAVVLVGVMIDRATLTMRTIAVAALAVMLLVPEAVVHPSFQMSFAATLALIGTYQGGLAWATAGADTSLDARLALWGVREIVLLAMASLVAGLATTPYAAYHFHRLAPYGVLANVLAMPVISAVSMPAGLLALLAMPFGFDGPLVARHGLGHRLDDPGVELGCASAGCGRAHPGLRCRCALVRDRGPDRDLLAKEPVALHRSRSRGGRLSHRYPRAPARCDRLGRRRRHCGAWRRRQAVRHQVRQRYAVAARMARRRRRRTGGNRPCRYRRICLRSGWLCRAARRRPRGRAVAHGSGARR